MLQSYSASYGDVAGAFAAALNLAGDVDLVGGDLISSDGCVAAARGKRPREGSFAASAASVESADSADSADSAGVACSARARRTAPPSTDLAGVGAIAGGGGESAISLEGDSHLRGGGQILLDWRASAGWPVKDQILWLDEMIANPSRIHAGEIPAEEAEAVLREMAEREGLALEWLAKLQGASKAAKRFLSGPPSSESRATPP